MPIPWNEDDPRDAAIIVRNLTDILRQKRPIPYYAGEIRDSDSKFPELYGYEVSVGTQRGVDSRLVPQQLASFETAMEKAVAVLDLAIPAGGSPADEAQLQSVLTLCANAHGEWIRIHPFANGNGRTARLWANWCALRYGVPPFVRLKPRPEGSSYATASVLSMRGDHQVMVAVFADMLDRQLGESAG